MPCQGIAWAVTAVSWHSVAACCGNQHTCVTNCNRTGSGGDQHIRVTNCNRKESRRMLYMWGTANCAPSHALLAVHCRPLHKTHIAAVLCCTVPVGTSVHIPVNTIAAAGSIAQTQHKLGSCCCMTGGTHMRVWVVRTPSTQVHHMRQERDAGKL